MLWDRAPASRNRRAGQGAGNRQSSLVARPGSVSTQNKKLLSSTKSSASFCDRAVDKSTDSFRVGRGNHLASSPPSKRRLTYQEKGKGKMPAKSQVPSFVFPMQNKGIVIRDQAVPERQCEAPFYGESRSVDVPGVLPKKRVEMAFSAPVRMEEEGRDGSPVEVIQHQHSERPSASMKLAKKRASLGEKENDKLAAMLSVKASKKGKQSLVFGSFGASCTKAVGGVQKALKGTNDNPLTISEGVVEDSDLASSAGFHGEKIMANDAGINFEIVPHERMVEAENDSANKDFEQNNPLLGLESDDEDGFGLINEEMGDNNDLELNNVGMEGDPSAWTESEFAELDHSEYFMGQSNHEVFEEGGSGQRRDSEVEVASLE